MTTEKIVFKDKKVKAKYNCLVDIDHFVEKPQVYRGPLSLITIEMAEAMIAGGSNLIKKNEDESASESKKS